jgi:hypothetical protein
MGFSWEGLSMAALYPICENIGREFHPISGKINALFSVSLFSADHLICVERKERIDKGRERD